MVERIGKSLQGSFRIALFKLRVAFSYRGMDAGTQGAVIRSKEPIASGDTCQ